MSPLQHASNAYERCRSFVTVNGRSTSRVELVSVEDTAGMIFDSALRSLQRDAYRRETSIWDEVIFIARIIRWRRLTRPVPAKYDNEFLVLMDDFSETVSKCERVVSNRELLDFLSAAAQRLIHTPSYVSQILVDACMEVGGDNSAVITENNRAQQLVAPWLAEYGIPVMSRMDLKNIALKPEVAYILGPPALFPPSLYNQPNAHEIHFYYPSWAQGDRLPESNLTDLLEFGFKPAIKHFMEEDPTSSPLLIETSIEFDEEDESEPVVDRYRPEPVWTQSGEETRELDSSEVSARLVILSGDRAIYLEDSERIRAYNPDESGEDSVGYIATKSVEVGTYLVLRDGEPEGGFLLENAYKHLAKQGIDARSTQELWKSQLKAQIQRHGLNTVVNRLERAGVRSAYRAGAWASTDNIRPQRNDDFCQLLRWLEIETEPTVSNAARLHSAIRVRSAEAKRALEKRISETSIDKLHETGHRFLDDDSDGVKGMLVARVLAISPWYKAVRRHQVREIFEYKGTQWLE